MLLHHDTAALLADAAGRCTFLQRWWTQQHFASQSIYRTVLDTAESSWWLLGTEGVAHSWRRGTTVGRQGRRGGPSGWLLVSVEEEIARGVAAAA